jgi:hypothetical protein
VQPKTHEDRDRTWRRWLGFCNQSGLLDPLLSQFSDRELELTMRSFLSLYQVGNWDKTGRLLGTNQKAMAGSSVRAAAGHLASAFRDRFEPSPIHVPDGSRLRPSITALLKAVANVEDPPNRQKAITPKFLRHLHRLGSPTVQPCAIDHAVDLLIGGFFFATRPCEIVRTKDPGRTKTLELRDLVFRDQRRRIIPHDDPQLLPRSEFVTLTWRDQKNGMRMDSRTQRRTRDPLLCPTSRFGRAVQRVHQCVPNPPPTTLLCTISDTAGSTSLLTDQFTLDLIRQTCAMFGGKSTFGFHPHEVGNRSLRSGAAMALFLKDHSTAKIMILGRWSSDAFLVYIRPQVLEWTNNMSRDMISFDSFLDVGLHDIASSHDPRTRRQTIQLNGRTSAMQMPTFHLQD